LSDTKKNSYLFLVTITNSDGTQLTAYLPTADINQMLGTSGTVYNNPNGIGAKYDFPTFFDTGGYTGEWGPEGRWAMLHQKEIVLNAHDTENLLQTVDIVRSIAS
jgi:hypothetical protein